MDCNKKIISIIGTGNVATHLYRAFSSCEASKKMDVRMINSRTLEGLPTHSDIILICVKDDAIGCVAEHVNGRAWIIAHTSGSVGMEILKGCGKHYGVFYPLQTFSKSRQLKYRDIPIFIEGSDSEALDNLTLLAETISDMVSEADSERRKYLHVAAVFACNFSNHLVALADSFLQKEGMNYRVLMPLLRETVAKLDILSPSEAQTGPAVRGDQSVMAAHMEMLSGNPEWQTIYKLLSDSIGTMKSKEC